MLSDLNNTHIYAYPIITIKVLEQPTVWTFFVDKQKKDLSSKNCNTVKFLSVMTDFTDYQTLCREKTVIIKSEPPKVQGVHS